jgi:hypothetical protein
MKTPEDEAFEQIERIQRTRTRWVSVKQPQDEIIELAKKYKLVGMRPHLDGIYMDALLSFAKSVAEAEREACAKLCDELVNDENTIEYASGAYRCSAQIRERRQA